MAEQLNVVTLFRRTRMQAFALHNLVTRRNERRLVARLSWHKSVDAIMSPGEQAAGANLWARLQNFSLKERLALAIVNRYYAASAGAAEPARERQARWQRREEEAAGGGLPSVRMGAMGFASHNTADPGPLDSA